jgi:hypothetical protein
MTTQSSSLEVSLLPLEVTLVSFGVLAPEVWKVALMGDGDGTDSNQPGASFGPHQDLLLGLGSFVQGNRCAFIR